MNTALYAALHFLVDFICAWAMFAQFGMGSYENLLIYNFFAFALQMPLGTLLDLCGAKNRKLPAVCAAAGAFLTAIGALLHPAILGLGNALFHVGGGVDVISEDFAKKRLGRELGLFVAPGAIGLYFGTLLGKSAGSAFVLFLSALGMAVLFTARFLNQEDCEVRQSDQKSEEVSVAIVAVCCFSVVALRSWIGLGISFDWKSVPVYGFLAVLATAGGKYCGGVLAAKCGIGKTAGISLILASLLYLTAGKPLFGLLTMLLFNMSMPLTLYLLAERLPRMPGFAFGLLTFGLFLGFLPVYFKIQIPIPGDLFGATGSFLSCILLILAGKAAYGKVSV